MPNPDLRTDPLLEKAASRRYSGDWDAGGTVSIHLPIDIAFQLLRERGWELVQHAQGGYAYVSPSGQRYWHADEALRIALTAEVA